MNCLKNLEKKQKMFNTLEDRVRDVINECLNRASRSGQEAYLEIQELSGKNHIIVLGSKENQINPFMCSNGISFECIKDNTWRFIHFSDIVTVKINAKDETRRQRTITPRFMRKIAA